jgi:hypothetical protein
MSRLLIALILVLQGFVFVQPPTGVSAQVPQSTSQRSILCMPGIYMTDPLDCLPLGPSVYRTKMASEGFNLPLINLPSHPVDPQLGEIPFQYAELGDGPTPVYPTLQDAMDGKNEVKQIDPGKLRYVSYIDYKETDKGRFFQLPDNTWVSVSSRVSVPHSYPGGVEFTRTPNIPFGWVLPFAASIETRRTPGYSSNDFTGKTVDQYQIVQVYSSQLVDGEEWDLIAPDEWIDGRYIGKVMPVSTPPAGIENGRWIEINLFEQTMAVYDQNKLVFATLVATGLEPFYTKPGLFQIQNKLDSTTMSGAFEANRSDYYYLEDVPWTMYYDHARALHGAYWRTAFGFPQSHGCVNLAPADSHWLFNWANVGDWVYVWDPSGNTPTDPSYYNDGGA